jgi:hypothetical protein
MSDLLSTEDFLLASDNQLGVLWAHYYIDGPYPEAIQDWLGARQVFYDAYVSYCEKQHLAEQLFRIPKALAPGSPVYLQSAQDALDAGRIVLDSEWHIDQTCVRVPVLQRTGAGIEATTVRNSKIYSRGGSQHDWLERGLVALALEENSISGVTVNSTRILNSEGPKGFSHTFKPPQQISAPADEMTVREGLDKLKRALADPMRPPETGEYCALLDDAGLCSEDGLLKRVSAQTGVDWRHLSASHLAVVERLIKCFEDKTMHITPDFCTSPSVLCFSLDVMPVRSTLLNPDQGGQMTVTPRAMAAAWNANRKISSMLFRLNDLRADSKKIAELQDKAGPLGQRSSFVECGNVHAASRVHQWFRRRFGIEHAKSLDSLYTNRNGCAHPELVQNGFTLEAWSKAFLGMEISSLSAQRPLQARLTTWNNGKQDAKLDAILCSRAETFAQGVLAAKAHLAYCQAKGEARELSDSRIIQIPIPTHRAIGKMRAGHSPQPPADLEQLLL